MAQKWSKSITELKTVAVAAVGAATTTTTLYTHFSYQILHVRLLHVCGLSL